MTEDQIQTEAQNIVDDIYAEHGEFAPHGIITLEEAIDTVSCYSNIPEEYIEEIAKYVVVLMEGEL